MGITKAHDRDELKAAIRLALANDRKVVFEAFVDGHEVECAVIGSDPAVSTRPGEILAGAEFYTYDDKYKNGVSQVVIPAKLPEEKLDEVKTYAAMAYTALGCEGLARCDFFVEKDTGRSVICDVSDFPYTLIWSAAKKPLHFICIEPWHSLPGEENGPLEWEQRPCAASLKRGESWSTTLSTTFVR